MARCIIGARRVTFWSMEQFACLLRSFHRNGQVVVNKNESSQRFASLRPFLIDLPYSAAMKLLIRLFMLSFHFYQFVWCVALVGYFIYIYIFVKVIGCAPQQLLFLCSAREG
ncbi:uncharacterized protein TEOVI_000400800 [Trypanosoma equiperdum]|uniref:Uncharacterized protein n=3 Tax=Trypanozoon TaxID=39700 RepID=Q388Y2_TRYB2|nr:hypothetical protein Tb10.389.1050 [Trypanosoma brucei brucei TREU927]EAN78638.1 hypothetical protein Tb10.389.1050 [Trypanosoma brucei brucei TREU927]SCU72431.1 hypothetical protein, conserved [Trypanosoma equiperdum]